MNPHKNYIIARERGTEGVRESGMKIPRVFFFMVDLFENIEIGMRANYEPPLSLYASDILIAMAHIL